MLFHLTRRHIQQFLQAGAFGSGLNVPLIDTIRGIITGASDFTSEDRCPVPLLLFAIILNIFYSARCI